MRKILLMSGIFIFSIISFEKAFAEGENINLNYKITLKHNYDNFTLDLSEHPEFLSASETYMMNGQEIAFEEKDYCTELDFYPELKSEEELNPDINIKKESGLNIDAIEAYLQEKVAPLVHKDVRNVKIFKDENGQIAFEGHGVFGEDLDVSVTARAIKKAIEENAEFVTLAVNMTEPEVNVEDEELKKAGIKDLIVIGESDFSNSPGNRIHNIHVGADTFDGVLVEKGEIFSFNDILGPVTGATGYRQELVIKGEETIPDYGGGLCQVSTTAFRAAMLGGFEIVERYNHAYAVSHYTPWGSDATIYIGAKNFRFKNDTEGAILVQTRIEGEDLYFRYYGTKDQRDTKLFGPYIGRWRSPLATKTKYTDKLAPGQKKLVSNRVSGLDATWFRIVKKEGKNHFKKIFSRFEPRGIIYLVGNEAGEGSVDAESSGSDALYSGEVARAN